MGVELGDRGGAAPAVRLHDRGDLLAPRRSGTPSTATSATGGMGEQHVLDLARVDVLAAADDHVLEPAVDAQVAALVHGAEVAGVQPALGVDGGGGRLGHLEVAVHRLVAAGAELALLARGQRLAGDRVGDLHLDLRERLADRVGLVVGAVVEQGLGDDAASTRSARRGSRSRTPRRASIRRTSSAGTVDAAGHHGPQRSTGRAGRGRGARAARSAWSAPPQQDRPALGLDQLEHEAGVEGEHGHVGAARLQRAQRAEHAARRCGTSASG